MATELEPIGSRRPRRRSAAASLSIYSGRNRNSRVPGEPEKRSQLAVEIIGASERSSIWVYDLTGSRSPRQLLGAASNARPLWTPDGARLSFASNRDGNWGIYWQAADGSGVAEKLTTAEPGVEHWPDSWSADMNTLAFTRIDGSLGAIRTQGISTVTLDDELVYLVRDRSGARACAGSTRLSAAW
jgi:Tol biopolymer transport system component